MPSSSRQGSGSGAPRGRRTAPATTTRTVRKGTATKRIAEERASKVQENKDKLAAMSEEDRALAEAMGSLSAAEIIEATEAAKLEQQAVKEAEAAGLEPPPTPNLDMLRAGSALREAGGKTSRRQPSGEQPATAAVEKKEPQSVHFTVDDKPVAPTQNRLSSISRVTANGEQPRWPAPQLREWLKEQGVEDPEHKPWEAVLPNGRKIGAVLPEQAAQAKAS